MWGGPRTRSTLLGGGAFSASVLSLIFYISKLSCLLQKNCETENHREKVQKQSVTPAANILACVSVFPAWGGF